MTLYHFGNCLALVYVPYHMAYKFSGITEYATFSKCIYAGGLYVFTQLCKMLLLATFFPDYDSSDSAGQYDIFLEILKATVDFADLIGLYFALNSVPGKGHAKIFTAAIGWASAEVLVTRSAVLWSEARGAAWSWRGMNAAAGANVALVHHAAVAGLIWLVARARPDVQSTGRAPLIALLVGAVYRPLLEDLLRRTFNIAALPLLVIRALCTIAAALATLALYAIREQQTAL